jgi:hypothetical protein
VSFAAVTLCVAPQWVFIVVYFVINLVRRFLDTPSYSGSGSIAPLILQHRFIPGERAPGTHRI